VLRQALVSTFGTADAAQGSAALTSSPHVAATNRRLSRPLSADADLQDALLPQARVAGAVDALAANNAGRIVLSAAALDNQVRGWRCLWPAPGGASGAAAAKRQCIIAGGSAERSAQTTTSPSMPARRRRFAARSRRRNPLHAPSIASNAPLAATAHHLLADTDAALARQTLMQVASLPDRVDTAGPRLDPAAPRWNFEIPLRRRRERRWRSSKFRAMAATAPRPKRQSGFGGPGSRSTSSRSVRSMRW